MPKKINLVGKTFGQLTVIDEGPPRLVGKKNPKNRATWNCLCSCGKIVNILGTNLRNCNRGTASCGCKFKNSKKYNFTDLTGNKYGQLMVLEKTDKFTKTRGAVWLCKCDCGDLVELPTNSLTSGNNITCSNKKNHTNNHLDPKWLRCGEIPIAHLNAIKNGAIKRNLSYNLTSEYLWNLFLSQNKKCALSGLDLKFTQSRNAAKTRALFTTASLDRIDCKIGYEEGNVRWVHKDLNKMKLHYNDELFYEYCRLCFQNQYSLNNIQRPSFDEYFMNIAFNVALRSDDVNIRHGAVLVTKDNKIIGAGYNGTIKHSDMSKIPYHIRDKKRKYMIHAEENCMLNCVVSSLMLEGSKMYITGLPCVNCLQRMINFGVSEIIYAKRIGSITEDIESEEIRQNIISMSKISIRELEIDTLWLKKNYHE